MPGDGRAQVDLDAGSGPLRRTAPMARERSDLPFRILVLADLRGSAVVGRDALDTRAPVRIDRDEFDDVLARFAPAAEVRLDGSREALASLRFLDIDDFHPDRLFARVPVFAALRDLRIRLEDPRRFREAAAELMGSEPDRKQPAAKPRKPGATLLDDILAGVDGGTGEPLPPPRPADPLQAFIQSIVKPHLVTGEDPRQAALIERVDRGVTTLMRALLHDPGLQAVESLWRSILLLVRQIETGPSLGIWLLDVTREELESDLAADRPIEATALYRKVVEREAGTAGGVPWSLLIGDLTFGPRPDHVRLLSRLAELGRATMAPFVAAAAPSLVGCRGFGQSPDPAGWDTLEHPEWAHFRASALARYVGLAAPRFLLRVPFGGRNEQVESFAFDEVDSPPDHEALLWGNPAFAVTVIIARDFARSGWSMQPGMNLDLGGLPLHLYESDGAITAQPCAEMLMTERAAARLLEGGIMPLASIRDTDRIRLIRVESVASPLAALAGRWGGP